MVSGRRSLKGQFSCESEPPVSARANASHADKDKQRNTVHVLFASLTSTVPAVVGAAEWKP